MEVGQQKRKQQDEEDPFHAFVDYARSVLIPGEEAEGDGGYGADGEETETSGPGWSWIASRILKTCIAYSSGVTAAILLSDLSQAWSEQHKTGAPKKRPEIINQLKKKHKRTKLLNAVTIDSIHEKNFLSLTSCLEAVVVDAFVLPGTNIYMLTLGDFWSSNTIDLYLHRRNASVVIDIPRNENLVFKFSTLVFPFDPSICLRYYDLVDPRHGILKKGREVFLTGCYLRTAREGSGFPRLLPTEYLVILLDDDQDNDAMLIAAQFCSDSFSSISLSEANSGVSYCLYGRIESIESKEVQGAFGNLNRKEITLIDNDSVQMKFLLWGDQTVLANLFSVGSMLALDKPYIASSKESAVETTSEVCLEYGSATQLYLVPFIQNEEQVYLPLSQNRYQGSRLMTVLEPSQGFKVSQVTLPRDSQGSVDFSNCPFRLYVVDLHDKMTGISLYGVVTDINCEKKANKVVYALNIEDTTGAIWTKLHFTRSWSLGRLCPGHTVYISGLSCYKTKQNCFELCWYENDAAASFVNLSCLPALLNSSCLQRISCLSDLSSDASCTYICRVRLEQVHQCHVNTTYSHSLCGHVVNITPSGAVQCSFCHCDCSDKIMRSFDLKISLSDNTAKIVAWSTGQTAAELLQISPDEFSELPEDEQYMYPSSLESETFIVALVNSKRHVSSQTENVFWEICRALRYE